MKTDRVGRAIQGDTEFLLKLFSAIVRVSSENKCSANAPCTRSRSDWDRAKREESDSRQMCRKNV